MTHGVCPGTTKRNGLFIIAPDGQTLAPHPASGQLVPDHLAQFALLGRFWGLASLHSESMFGRVDVGPCWDLSRTRHDVHGTVQGLYSNTPRTYDKKTLNWALGQAFLKAYIGIPYMRVCLGVQKRVILDSRFRI